MLSIKEMEFSTSYSTPPPGPPPPVGLRPPERLASLELRYCSAQLGSPEEGIYRREFTPPAELEWESRF